MTATEIARRSDALYEDNTGSMTRRVLCDMVAQREADLEDARAEFDKMDKWHSAELQAAMTENAKLRELVRDLWPFVKAGLVSACPNRECCLFEECDADSEYECLIEEHMAGRVRELGVEVDG